MNMSLSELKSAYQARKERALAQSTDRMPIRNIHQLLYLACESLEAAEVVLPEDLASWWKSETKKR